MWVMYFLALGVWVSCGMISLTAMDPKDPARRWAWFLAGTVGLVCLVLLEASRYIHGGDRHD